MNQDQVREKLLQLQPDTEDFTLIFSGKKSKKVNGIYHPEQKEIIIHNRNFDSGDPEKDGNGLLYTAIHEFAHHIHFTTSPVPISSKAHTTQFRNIFHRLLYLAEEKKIYKNIFDTHPGFIRLTQRIRKEFIEINGGLMKTLGGLFLEAEKLCRENGARFEDYIERVLQLEKKTAETIIRIHEYDLPPSLGYENMRTLAGIRNNEERMEAWQAFTEGQTPDMVKASLRGNKPEAEEDPVERLEKEKQRIERTITSLREKLKEVEKRIEEMHSAGSA